MQALATRKEVQTSLRPQVHSSDPHDRDLESRVRNYLVGYKMPALGHVRVVAEDGSVFLSGRLCSFYQKQLCINCCRRVAGVIRLIDQLEVSSGDDSRSPRRPR
jgi:osmotically-inducible protein OsmY